MKKKQQDDNNDEAPAKALPPADFCNWWNPTGTEAISGAHIGGHTDADRVWARKDPGKWTRRRYGINATEAWECRPYRDEYQRWVDADRPECEPFVSLAATLDKQGEFWRGLTGTLAEIGKRMADAKAEERARIRLLQQQKVKLLADAQHPPPAAEPIDF
jgi:hypothetical protein